MSIEEAKKIRKRYYPILNRARWNSTLGKTKDASIVYMRKITEYYQSLRDVGYRIDDNRKLVKITEEWKKQELEKMSEIDKLFYEARKLKPEDGIKLINKAILLMGESNA